MDQSPTLRPSRKRDKPPPVIHAIEPVDQGFTRLLCQPEKSIGEYRVTTHPDLLVTADGEMFSPKWTLATCGKCADQRLARRTELIYDLVIEYLKAANSATCTQLWNALRPHPTAKYINLSRGILQITLRELVSRAEDHPRRLVYEEHPAPGSPPGNPIMAHWYKKP